MNMAKGLWSRYNHRQREKEMLKNNPELREKLRKERRLYCLKNKKKLKKYHKIYQKTYKKEMQAIAKELGNCLSCYKEKDNPKLSTCSICRLKAREYQKIYYLKHKK
jgi:recombinational DNA repair protein RecR